jgi:hypothetical protein
VSDWVTFGYGQFELGTFYLLKDAQAVGKQSPAGVGHRDAPAIAHEQRLFQLDLKLTDFPAERGLCDEQYRRCSGETAKLGDMRKIFELL